MEKHERILEEYKKYLELKSISSVDAYIKGANEFLTYVLEEDLDFLYVDESVGEDYRAYLLTREENYSRRTINGKLNRLRSFYTFLFKKRMVPENIFKDLKGIRVGKSLPKNILSVADMGLLLDSFSIMSLEDVMLKSMLEFLYGSSMRISEVKALKLEDLDFETGSVYITNFKNGGKRWKAPATEVALRYVRKYIATVRDELVTKADRTAGFIYPQHKGSTTIRGLLNKKLRRECSRLGLKEVTSHSFRHSSATHMLKAGAGIRQVQMMLGHERITSTQHYLRIVKEDLKNVLSEYHPRERGLSA